MNFKLYSCKWLTALIIMLLSCAQEKRQEIIQSWESGLQTGQWLEDLDYLATELPKHHKNLFFQLKEEDFHRDIEKLKDEIPYLEDYKIIAGIMKIIAKVGDSHTSVAIWKIPAFRYIPVDFKLYSDGVFATAAIEEYKTVVGKKLIRINQVGIEKVIDRLEAVIPHENEAQIKGQVPWLLGCSEILDALDIVDGPDSVKMEFEGVGEILLRPVHFDTEGINLISAFDEGQELPLYLRNKDLFYWYYWIDDKHTLYFQYNRCAEADTLTFKDFMEEMLAFMDDHKIEKFIFDMRLNGGGNSSIAEPLIKALKDNEQINHHGKLFVCIGRNTFSSAILNSIKLKKETNAIFVGEPTGGKPNHYGEVRNLILPNSGITINYSTKYFKETEEDEPSLYPDIEIELSSTDFFTGRDPVLEAVLRNK